MTRDRTRTLVCVLAALVTAVAVTDNGPIRLGGRDAEAVVGRPGTPVSYAGVARRTARRTTYRTAAYTGAYAGPPAVAALPAGCVYGGGIYSCGATRYRAYYDGPNLVYVVVQ